MTVFSVKALLIRIHLIQCTPSAVAIFPMKQYVHSSYIGKVARTEGQFLTETEEENVVLIKVERNCSA